MTTDSERAGIIEKQAALAKMGGGKRSGKRSCNCKSCNYKRQRPSKRHSRKIRGGAVAPTTPGGSQGGSNKLFMAQQQAAANRAFDNS